MIPFREKKHEYYAALLESSDKDRAIHFMGKYKDAIAAVSEAYKIIDVSDSSFVVSHLEALEKGKKKKAKIVSTVKVTKVTTEDDSVMAEISVTQSTVKYEYSIVKIRWNRNHEIPESFLTEPKIAAALFRVHDHYINKKYQEARKILYNTSKNDLPKCQRARRKINEASIDQWYGTIFNQEYIDFKNYEDKLNAIEYFEKALKNNPDLIELHDVLANLYFHESYLKPIIEFQECSEKVQKNIINKLNKSVEHCMKYEEAIKSDPSRKNKYNEIVCLRDRIENYLIQYK